MRGNRCAVNHSITCIPASQRAHAVEQHFDTALNAKEFGIFHIFHTTGAGQLIEGDIEAQTARVLDNLKAVLEACGCSLSQVVKTTVYLKDMGEFARMNEVYARYFPENPPARATVEAARLPRDVRVEIDCIAVMGT